MSYSGFGSLGVSPHTQHRVVIQGRHRGAKRPRISHRLLMQDLLQSAVHSLRINKGSSILYCRIAETALYAAVTEASGLLYAFGCHCKPHNSILGQSSMEVPGGIPDALQRSPAWLC